VVNCEQRQKACEAREKAKRASETRYKPGYGCARGHWAERYVKDNKCVRCLLQRKSLYYSRFREGILDIRRAHYATHRKDILKRAADHTVDRKRKRKADRVAKRDREAAALRAQLAEIRSRDTDAEVRAVTRAADGD